MFMSFAFMNVFLFIKIYIEEFPHIYTYIYLVVCKFTYKNNLPCVKTKVIIKFVVF